MYNFDFLPDKRKMHLELIGGTGMLLVQFYTLFNTGKIPGDQWVRKKQISNMTWKVLKAQINRPVDCRLWRLLWNWAQDNLKHVYAYSKIGEHQNLFLLFWSFVVCLCFICPVSKFKLCKWAASSEFVFEHSVMTNFNCACPAIHRDQGSGFLSEGSSWLTIVWASSGGSGETARMPRLAWTFAARICDKYQIRLTRPLYSFVFAWVVLFKDAKQT